VPAEVVPYLEKLRASGVAEALVDGERDGWILVSARWPDKIPSLMIVKMAQLEDPRTLQFYRLIGEMLDPGVNEDRLGAAADLLAEMAEDADENGELNRHDDAMSDDAFVALLDSFAADAHPLVERLQELMTERGWTGWSRIRRTAELSAPREFRP
jgi:hypothetical protein